MDFNSIKEQVTSKYNSIKDNILIKMFAVFMVIFIIMSLISKCNHSQGHTYNKPKDTVVSKKIDTIKVEKIVEIPVYLPPKIVTKIVTRNEIRYDTIVSVLNKFIKDTTIQSCVTNTKYPDAEVIDSITYVGDIIKHKQTLDIKGRIDTIKIPVSTIITQSETVTISRVEEVIAKKAQMYAGFTVASQSNNLISIQPQIGIRFKRGLTVNLAKDLFCPQCATISTSLPITIKKE